MAAVARSYSDSSLYYLILMRGNKRTAGKGAQKRNNLKTDRQEGIKTIDWNSYGKMSRLIKGTATDDTLTMVFHYDGMGNRIRKDVWREVPGGTGGTQDRVSDIYVRDAQGNILAVYKEQARLNGGATIDWLNSQLYQVATVPELAVFYSTQFGNNGNFSGNLYDYGLLKAPDWASAQLSERSGRFYINQSDYMFGHALETQLAEAWADLRDMDPAEFLPLLKENEGDLGRTGRLVSAALQSSSISVNTLEHLSNTDNDFMVALFLHLPDGSRIEDAQKVADMGQEGRMAHLYGLMDRQGTAAIADAFVQASLNTPPNSFLESWLYDDKVFNSTNLANDDELKKNLKDCIISSENVPALTVVRDQFGNWMDATLPHYVEESFTPQDRLNVVYNSDKVAFLESFIGTNGMTGVTGALVQIPGLTGLSYSNTILNGVSLGLLNPAILQYVNTPSPQNIDTDSLWLAEHHLYGSSRLGIKQYAPHQYRNVYSNTQPFVKGINVKQPWYSTLIEEEIKSGIKSLPLLSTHYLVDSFRYKRDLGTKYYELSDHLGNVLATVLDRKTGYGSLNGEYAGFKADIASATDYYPFGMEMPGRSFSSENSRFGFNGYEKDNEVKGNGNSVDFTARMYDSRVGRFLSIDPYYSKFPSESHYEFAGNNPIYYIDKDGKHKLHPDIAKNYPAVYKYLSSQIEQDVMNSTYIKNAYKHLFANMPDAEIRSAFKDGSVPTLFPDEFPGGQDAAGHYFDPERLVAVNREIFKYANDVLVNKDGKFTEDQRLEGLTLLYSVILHETSHFFEHEKRRQNLETFSPLGEPGYDFESLIYKLFPDTGPELKDDEKLFKTRASSRSPKLQKGVIMGIIQRAREEDANKGTEWKKTLPTVPKSNTSKPQKKSK